MTNPIDAIEDKLVSPAEKAVLEYLIEDGEWSNLSLERGSDNEWDFSVSGTQVFRVNPSDEGYPMNFSAGPKRALIRSQNWPTYAYMSDYPEMVEFGDWSGVRDSSASAIDAMFEQAIADAGISLASDMKP